MRAGVCQCATILMRLTNQKSSYIWLQQKVSTRILHATGVSLQARPSCHQYGGNCLFENTAYKSSTVTISFLRATGVVIPLVVRSWCPSPFTELFSRIRRRSFCNNAHMCAFVRACVRACVRSRARQCGRESARVRGRSQRGQGEA